MSIKELKKNTGHLENVILNPRITEKSSDKSEDNVYVFDVDPRANKTQIKEAIKSFYKVNAVKVNIAQVPSKNVFSRGKKGVKTGGKKAFVFLKEGDKIEII